MHDACGVRFGQPVGDLDPDVEDPSGLQRDTGQHVTQRSPVHVLHHEIRGTLDVPDFVNRDDVGVIQRRGGAGLRRKAGDAVGIGRDLLGQELDGHVPAEVVVTGAKHLAHATAAQPRDELVSTQPRADRRGHEGHSEPRGTGGGPA